MRAEIWGQAILVRYYGNRAVFPEAALGNIPKIE
jgi:hypothetical protein